MDVKSKLTKARAGLVLSSPFFASIALQLKLKEDTECETAYTDSVVLGYNPNFISELSNAEVKGLICHEVLHIAMLHPFRKNSREHIRWNIACDYAVNPIVRNEGYTLPEGALSDAKFKDLEAEVIYNQLPKSIKIPVAVALMGEVRDYKQDKSDSKGSHGNTLPQQIKNCKITIARAAAVAKAQGRLPAGLERIIVEVLQPKLPWKEILSRFITENVRNDYTWKTPNKRYLYADMYLPSLNTPTLGSIVIIVDTSGSISQKELNVFASELHSILSTYPGTTVKVIYVNVAIANIEDIDIYNFNLHAKGGGGTDFKPGFAYIVKEDILPSCVIYFTDGYCDSFPDSPDYPVLWILTGKASFTPPFGEVIHMG